MLVRYDKNEYGTRISVHKCDTCGVEFSVCPAIEKDNLENWANCLGPDCPSYDIERDGDLLFDENGMTNKLMMDSKLDEEVWDIWKKDE